MELQFAHIKRLSVVGGSDTTKEAGTTLSVRTRNTAPIPGSEIAKILPASHENGFTSEAEYWQGFSKFLRFGLLFAPVGLAVKNIGGTTATESK